jgi:GT2 family glycosyltransferase
MKKRSLSGNQVQETIEGSKDLVPTVSVIILNYNGCDYIETCLLSLLDLEFPKEQLEIIIVDNGSTDNSTDLIQSKFPDIRLIRNETNLGFSRAANQGAASAKGEYLAFLNNDMRVAKNWLKALLQAIQREPEIGCIGSLVMNWDGTAVDFWGRSDDLFGLDPIPSNPPAPASVSSSNKYTMFASGGAMLIRRDVFQELGGFDVDYFMYHEDVDLGWRLWLRGYKCVLTPLSVVYHKGGASSGRLPREFVDAFLQKHVLFTVFKNLEGSNLAVLLPLIFYLFLDHGRYWLPDQKLLPEITQEFRSSLKPLIDKRIEVQKTRVMSDAEIFLLVGHPFNFLLQRQSYGIIWNEIIDCCSKVDFDPNDVEAAQTTITEWLNAAHFVHERHLVAELHQREQDVQTRSGQVIEKEQQVQALSAQVAEKEQAVQALQTQVTKKERAVQKLSSKVAQKEQTVQALSAQVAEKEQAVQTLTAQVTEIRGSRAWRLIQILWRIRTTLAPHGSRRERLAGLVRKSRNILGTEGLTALIRSAVKFSRRKTTVSTDLPLPTIPAIDKSIFDNLDLSTEKVIQAFSNKPVNDPDVSIVIPAYNHLDDTLRCLLSVAITNEKTKFEIIIADDASTDGTRSLITRCQGLRYIRNEQNLGFLRNCNRAAATARGKYIMFLNNDVIVLPHWLDTIIEAFSNFPDAGLVGSKLLYPDGTLQEAGGVMWNDGTGLNYGRYDDPRKPEYNYLREVDYCSGASIVIRRSLWEQLGGFDELFTPAYYEDTDLAFRVRQAGYNVIYQPLSQVFHVEGTTSGTDVNAGIKHYQEVNRHKFVERWKNAIRGYGVRESTEEFSYRNHYRKQFALFIDACTPTPDQDSGSIDAFIFLRMLRGLGFEVSFIPATNLLYLGRYTQDLQGIGIVCQYAPFIRSVEDFLKDEGKRFDLVFLSRAPTAAKYIDLVRQYSPRARIVFNTVDLHFLREERAAELGDSKASFEQARETREQEISVMRKADQTILVSEFEYKVVRDCAPEVKATVIPLPREIPGRSAGFEGRSDVLFLGGYNHPPNIDAVYFFVNKIWPLIKKQVPACRFLIAGSHMPEKVRKLGRKDDIVILGHVSDLDGLYSRCKLSVAPLRYGAGVKGKVVTSLGYGVPCVATSMAAEGMELKDGIHALVADTPEEFAEAVVRVYNSTELWEKLSQNGLAFVQERFSVDRVQSKFRKMLKDMGLVM